MTLSTTIKRIWLDKILAGTKTRELKKASEFWKKRLGPIADKVLIYEEIVFICGKLVVRYKVKFVTFHFVTSSPH